MGFNSVNSDFERFENCKYLRVILNEDNSHQIDLQEKIKNANKTYFIIQNFFFRNRKIYIYIYI